MRLLLDTHVLLWAVAASRRLPKAARALIQDHENEVFYSAASVWEISIKAGLRRSDFRIDVEQFHAALPQVGFSELAVRAAHAVAVSRLPALHRDPFPHAGGPGSAGAASTRHERRIAGEVSGARAYDLKGRRDRLLVDGVTIEQPRFTSSALLRSEHKTDVALERVQTAVAAPGSFRSHCVSSAR